VSSGHHFVSFTQIDEDMYEIDGLKPFPLCHGKLQGNILFEAAKVIRTKYMTDPSILDFSMISLAPPLEDD